MTSPDLEVLEFRFFCIGLRKLDWRRYLTCHSPMAAAPMAKMGYAQQERPKVKAECLRLLAALSLDSSRSALVGCFVETHLALSRAEQAEYNRIVEGFPMHVQQSMLDMTRSWQPKGCE